MTYPLPIRTLVGLIIAVVAVGCAPSVANRNSGATIDQAQQEPVDGPKKRIAVMPFDVKVHKAGSIGNGMSDMLADALVNTNRFIVLERQNAKDVMAEQDFGRSGRVKKETAPQIGELEGAQLLIRGAVTVFEPECSAGTLAVVGVKQACVAIATAGEDAAQLVRALREFYRHRDHAEVFEPVSISELLATAVSLTEPKWRVQTQAAGRTIRLVTELQDAGIVDGNSAELRDVFTNVIFNAVDAMPEGGTLTVRALPDSATSSAVAEVTDSGTGMTPEVQRRCFEPFFTTKGHGGTGLGLARVYGIIQRHRGTIEIDSAPGRGTTIRIRLPLRIFGETVGERLLAGVQVRPLSVLLVEDDPVPLQVVERLLSGDGHTVSTATNGLEALEKFQVGWFDVGRDRPRHAGDERRGAGGDDQACRAAPARHSSGPSRGPLNGEIVVRNGP